MVGMVGISLHHSAVLSSSDCHCCARLASVHSRGGWEDIASPMGFAFATKLKPAFGRTEEYRQGTRRLKGLKGDVSASSLCRGARVEIWGIGFARLYFVPVAAGKKILQFRRNVSGNDEQERDSDGGDRVTLYRRGEMGSWSSGRQDGEGESAAEDSEFFGESEQRLRPADSANDLGDENAIAAAAKASTSALEASTDALLGEAEVSARRNRNPNPTSTSNTVDYGTQPRTRDQDQNLGSNSGLQDERFLRRVAASENAETALALISEIRANSGGLVTPGECKDLMLAAIAQNNVDLAFSILNAMRSSLLQRRVDREEGTVEDGEERQVWRWPQPDVTTYIALVRGLVGSLRVSDAIQTVGDVRRRGVPLGDEVPFGKVVTCPTCMTSLAVVQPQHGLQLVPCSSCRYQYELMSGVIVSSESESISADISIFRKGLQVLPFFKRPIPAAVHSIVVQAPDGLARTHRFATESADVPAQEGERITIALASPENAARGVGPIRLNARTPGWQPSEAMAITNHATGRVASLIRAPPKAGSGALLDTSAILPVALLLASTDAASGFIDPTLPRLIAVGAAAAVALGGVTNTFLLPRLNQLPQRTVDAIALRQRLLAQHEQLQKRLHELTQATADEVRMLARMCQLQNKMEAVDEASYSARIDRVNKARQGLDERLAARLELIDSYAKVASMIEIEVEMDADVLAAEAANPEATIAEQIERLMEVESLQKEWRNQAEANDEVERLLRSAPLLPDSA